jgi:hypothetical protein
MMSDIHPWYHPKRLAEEFAASRKARFREEHALLFSLVGPALEEDKKQFALDSKSEYEAPTEKEIEDGVRQILDGKEHAHYLTEPWEKRGKAVKLGVVDSSGFNRHARRAAAKQLNVKVVSPPAKTEGTQLEGTQLEGTQL